MPATAADDRLAGVLLGTALGDALGLPFEGLTGERVRRRIAGVDRFHLFGNTGFVSDDTEQAALVAQALIGAGSDTSRCVRLFRRSMMGWFARLPFGIGGATLRACLRMMVGFARPGVKSAGNGAAMRASIIGAHHADDATHRREIGRVIASVTHTDERAIESALYVAEVAANAVLADSSSEPIGIIKESTDVLTCLQLTDAVSHALELARGGASLETAAAELGTSGFVIHSMGLCTYCFARHGAVPMLAIDAAVRAGGDTDTHAAIVGSWTGALHGAAALPPNLLAKIHDGPFGPTHLRGLAAALASTNPAPRWSWLGAFLRNLALYPVILGHGFARLFRR